MNPPLHFKVETTFEQTFHLFGWKKKQIMNMDKNVLHYLKSDLVLMTQTPLVLVQSRLIETLKHLRT